MLLKGSQHCRVVMFLEPVPCRCPDGCIARHFSKCPYCCHDSHSGPILGDYHFSSHVTQWLREKYGDVFTVHLGTRPVVMLCGTEALREALVDHAEAFSGRGTVAVLEPVVQGYGVIFANGERWKALRRFSLATMRDFGMGKRSVEEQIKEEARCLVEELRKSQGAPLDPTFLFQCITANIICSIVFGERFDYKDRQFLRLLDLFYQTFLLISSFSSQVFELFSGILKYFPGVHKQIFKNVQEILNYIGHNVEKHRTTLDPSNPRDFIDTYLIRMEKVQSPGSALFLSYWLTENRVAVHCFCEGTEILCCLPFCAEKVQKEIDQVIGSHRPPTLDDRTKMPYTDAVIHEIQRFSDIVPIGLPHKVTKDTLFRGYLLPKNTEVYPILSAALHDPRYFEQPDDFNPDHFLDANGALKKNEAFMPFSIGKRICLGEGIARNELFLFFTTILQNFSVSSPVAPKHIDLRPKESGVSKILPKYQIHFLPR
ncbi:cytochrome P450 2B1-like [Microtus ochrogaster]|uniref:Cytochrome P450 n=1 Tax=Microtus ochrogaster TaxID=79684 RepID=A0ABM0LS17_MICOH|nr:cytochrome P450 2B1-like [Microtus ochrogaster]